MKNLKQVKCLFATDGYTVGKTYDVARVKGQYIVILDNSGSEIVFDSIEGEHDFKNFFIGVTA